MRPSTALAVLSYGMCVTASYSMSSKLSKAFNLLRQNSAKEDSIRMNADDGALQAYDADGKVTYEVPISVDLQAEYTNEFVPSLRAIPELDAEPEEAKAEAVAEEDGAMSTLDNCPKSQHPRNIFQQRACPSLYFRCVPGTTRGGAYCRYCFGCDGCRVIDEIGPFCIAY